jgi:hypothetical protein
MSLQLITRIKHFKLLAKYSGVAREYYVEVSYKYDPGKSLFLYEYKKKSEKYKRKSFPSDMTDPSNTRAIANRTLYRLYWSY